MNRTNSTTSPPLTTIDISKIREEIVGMNLRFPTPFGPRLMVYADYTASGRTVRFIEHHLMKIQDSYANTHTEDDETGRSTTELLHQAESTLKRAVNGNEDTCIIAAGTGTTGAIQKLQEIIGVYMPPATRAWVHEMAERYDEEAGSDEGRHFLEYMKQSRPVIFVGPYEHHSNEISWRESLGEVVEIALSSDGLIDLDDLEKKLIDPRFDGRKKIGSFSAASNVTGVKTPVFDVARILHRHGALVCFDFAASAPYVEIDMNRDEESFFDAVFFSPHKFLGGPGSSGVLLFNKRIYRSDLPPTFAAGGTVDYVGHTVHDFIVDIEEREKAGTPGTLQLMKAALAMELKQAIGLDQIEKREHDYISQAIKRLSAHRNVEILGKADPDHQIAILSFNLCDGDRYIHPKLVTRLCNDLFGIQSRAGCSCAGPYGHQLLEIGVAVSSRYRDQIVCGYQGIKPGWVRVGFHYAMDQIDVDYVLDALLFLADYGSAFLPLYRFNLESGTWSHVDDEEGSGPEFGIQCALQSKPSDMPHLSDQDRKAEYDRYLAQAAELAADLRAGQQQEYQPLPDELEDLSYFNVVAFDD